MNHADLIDRLGGPTEVSRHLGRPFQTVRFWRRRSNIPPEYWPEVLDLARLRGIRASAATLMNGVRKEAGAS
jgi:hypothetical protein